MASRLRIDSAGRIPPGLSAGPHSVTARRVRSCGAGRRDQGPHLQLHAPRYGLLHEKVLHTRRARTHTQDMSESGQQRAGRSRFRRSDIARPAAAEGQGSPRRSRPGHGGHVEVRPDRIISYLLSPLDSANCRAQEDVPVSSTSELRRLRAQATGRMSN
jgi:hypothetical protein